MCQSTSPKQNTDVFSAGFLYMQTLNSDYTTDQL